MRVSSSVCTLVDSTFLSSNLLLPEWPKIKTPEVKLTNVSIYSLKSDVLEWHCSSSSSEKEAERFFFLSRAAAGYFYSADKPPTPNHRLWNWVLLGRTFTFLLRRGNTSNSVFRDGRAHGIVQNTSTKTTEARNTSWVPYSFSSCCRLLFASVLFNCWSSISVCVCVCVCRLRPAVVHLQSLMKYILFRADVFSSCVNIFLFCEFCLQTPVPL